MKDVEKKVSLELQNQDKASCGEEVQNNEADAIAIKIATKDSIEKIEKSRKVTMTHEQAKELKNNPILIGAEVLKQLGYKVEIDYVEYSYSQIIRVLDKKGKCIYREIFGGNTH